LGTDCPYHTEKQDYDLNRDCRPYHFSGFPVAKPGHDLHRGEPVAKKHIVNQQYSDFLDKFGEEGNLIVIGFQDTALFTPKAYAAWNELMTGLKNAKAEVELVVSLNDLKKLEKDTLAQQFRMVPLIDQSQTLKPEYLQKIKTELFERLPFYEGLLFNKASGSVRSVVYMRKSVVNTAGRKTFIVEKLVPAIDKFERNRN
jgi:hypothetical protein